MSAGKDSSSSPAGGFEQEAASTPHFAKPDRNEPATPVISAGSGFEMPANIAGPATPTPPPLLIPATSQPPISGQAPPLKKRRKTWFIALMLLLLLVLVGSGLGTFFLLTQHNSAPVVSTSNTAGQAFFVSSGKVSTNGSQGINDELEINLHNIPAPAPGTSYYAWLLQDSNQPAGVPLLLGKLQVNNGTLKFLYPGNVEHTNLLASTSRVLITVGDTNVVPINPLPDSSTWHYIAELPQKPDPNDTTHHFSMLDHLRYLLAENPMLASVGKHGGLSTWLQRSAGKILEWASGARDYWDSKSLVFMRAHFIRILDYLDGQAEVQVDVPPGTPLAVGAPVALIGTDMSPPSDYLHQISGQLNGIAQAPGVTSDQRKLVVRISIAMDDVRAELENVRRDAKQLLNMSDAQLFDQSSLLLLDHMVTQAFYACSGQVDPRTGQLQSGAEQISYDIERLATLDVIPYKS